ncbi:MAG TPA: hypothetical protein PKV82_15175, partial [Anaerolineae bacterium]|nr:hypothetical protein [Anaerolineae bacterium]
MAPRVQLGSVPFSIWPLTVADNSITSAKIADGAVTSRTMNAAEAYSYVAEQGSTASTEWVDLGAPQSVTLQLDTVIASLPRSAYARARLT